MEVLDRGNGESAGARTQDQRLKRAMLYQLSYALKPHYQVSTFGRWNFAAKQRRCKLLPSILFLGQHRSHKTGFGLRCLPQGTKRGRKKLRTNGRSTQARATFVMP